MKNENQFLFQNGMSWIISALLMKNKGGEVIQPIPSVIGNYVILKDVYVSQTFFKLDFGTVERWTLTPRSNSYVVTDINLTNNEICCASTIKNLIGIDNVINFIMNGGTWDYHDLGYWCAMRKPTQPYVWRNSIDVRIGNINDYITYPANPLLTGDK